MTKRKYTINPGVRVPSDTDKCVGERIREIRVSKGLSRRQIANRVHVTHQQIQKYEKGYNRMSVGRLVEIADAMDCHVTELLQVEDTKMGDNTHSRLELDLMRSFAKLDEASRQKVSALVRVMAEGE